MRYSTGRTWEPQPGTWEKFELWVEEQDLLEWCSETGLDYAKVAVPYRFLIVRLLAERCEAAELSLRHYMEPPEASARMSKADEQLKQLAERLRTETSGE
jgi:hypothetical protein